MFSATDELTLFWLMVGGLALVTFASRVAGPMILALVPNAERFERFLQGLAIAVIPAMVVSLLLKGGPRELASVAFVVVAMIIGRNAVLAMCIGMAAAAVWTRLF